MIKSFRCKDTEAMFGGTRVAPFANIQTIAMRKLAMLNQAVRLDDFGFHPVIGWKRSGALAPGSTAFA